MILRADHVAGATFVGVGLLIFALSGDLPAGRLSMPGSGFLPKIIATLLILFGAALVLRARESEAFSAIGWNDLPHALQVIAIAAAGIALYTKAGFLLTLFLMIAALLIVIERRNPLRVAIYAASVVVITFVGFEYVLKTPMPNGPWGF
jgi:Tripartite tricarboxylate transporter TctB family